MKTDHDDKLIRCPKLGDEMTFSYCLKEAGSLPCARIIQCWFRSFDIEALLRDQLTTDEWERFANPPTKDKLISLIEIIEKAKRQT